jgi:hypothetical protein
MRSRPQGSRRRIDADEHAVRRRRGGIDRRGDRVQPLWMSRHEETLVFDGEVSGEDNGLGANRSRIRLTTQGAPW